MLDRILPTGDLAIKKDYLRIGYFELTKSGIETQRQRYWQDYFNTGVVSPEAPAHIRKASSIIEFSNLTEEELNMARTLERAQAIYDADMYGSYIEGEAKGRAEGLAESKAEGLAEGIAEGVELLAGFLRDGLSVEEALKKAMDALNVNDDKQE